MYDQTGYGIPVDPALYRRAMAGPGIGARLDSGLRSLFGGASPVTSPAYLSLIHISEPTRPY